MEFIEHKAGSRAQAAVTRAGALGPVIGALVGVVPQCGFSAVSASLYAGRVITLGTFFAVILSTSDEMLPIFLAEQVNPLTIISIMGAKVLVGMVMGFIIDAALRVAQRESKHLRIHELCVHDNCGCAGNCATCTANPALAYEHADDCSATCTHEHHAHDHTHDHTHDHAHPWRHMLKSALKHTLQVTVFILLITLALNALLAALGEDTLAAFISASPSLSVVASCLVALIPNCAASVVIADLYVQGILGAGAMFGGLLVSAGVGLLVLFQANRRPRQNLLILLGLFVTGVFWGMITNALGIVF
jgi:hypothetical protein